MQQKSIAHWLGIVAMASVLAATVLTASTLPSKDYSPTNPPAIAAGETDTGGDSPLTTSYIWQGHGGVVVTPLPFPGESSPTGIFAVDSIPDGSTIAYACFASMGWQTGPISSATSFNGTALDTIAPTAYDPAPEWNLCFYRWDVTNLVSGNGTYPFSCSYLGLGYAVYLVVIYEHPASPWVNIVLNDGSESLQGATSTCYLAGFESGPGVLRILTHSGDPGGGNEFISFNGQMLAGPGSIFEGTLGPVADCFEFTLPDVEMTDTLTIGTGGDWIGIHLAVMTGSPATKLDLIPMILPIQIPAGGGSFDFLVHATNYTLSSLGLELWSKVILPNGTSLSPMLGPVSIVLNSGTIAWYRHQNVPEQAPPGTYAYVGYLGDYPNQLWAMDSFPLEKLPTGGDTRIGDWSCTGEEIAPDVGASAAADCAPMSGSGATPSTVISPNPFNPTTFLNFELRDASFVTLAVYDISGCEVATLVDGWREAGAHQITFDGSGLPSGIYVYRIEAGGWLASGKMVLLK